MARRGNCDTIVFGDVLGYEKAFLIQNMCPVTDRYIKSIYVDSKAVPVRVDGALEQRLIRAGKKVLALVRQGKPLVFPDIMGIESKLLAEMLILQ